MIKTPSEQGRPLAWGEVDDAFVWSDAVRELSYGDEQFVVFPEGNRWVYACGGDCREAWSYSSKEAALCAMQHDVAQCARDMAQGNGTYLDDRSTAGQEAYVAVADLGSEGWLAAWSFGGVADFYECTSRRGARAAAELEMESWLDG